jgi:hypothetical protein
MKKYFLPIFLFTLLLLTCNFSFAQGVAVNTDGSTADPSAVLDVKSTAKGVLVPRMALSDRNLITSPAAGLLIYQTDNTPGFYYNAGTPVTPNWTLLGATGAGFTNGTAAGQIYLTGNTPFSPQSPQTVTGDVSISPTAVTSYNNVVPISKGGTGTASPSLAAGTNVTITGSFPNQTINSDSSIVSITIPILPVGASRMINVTSKNTFIAITPINTPAPTGSAQINLPASPTMGQMVYLSYQYTAVSFYNLQGFISPGTNSIISTTGLILPSPGGLVSLTNFTLSPVKGVELLWNGSVWRTISI